MIPGFYGTNAAPRAEVRRMPQLGSADAEMSSPKLLPLCFVQVLHPGTGQEIPVQEMCGN